MSPDLPEHLARLYNYQTGKFDTPLDSQGIADIDATFELAIRTYPDNLPSFDDSERNVHHIYWTERFWKCLARTHPSGEPGTIHEFRNSTPQLAYVPLPIHRWIEEIMEPPPPPPIEIMRRRNTAWRSARILLQGVRLVDMARSDYEEKKHSTRRVLGCIEGTTPLSQQSQIPVEDKLNRDYWLSELNARLDGWKYLSRLVLDVPQQDRIIPVARLASARELRSRIKHGAIVPRVSAELNLAS